jgi:hypothetical protein
LARDSNAPSLIGEMRCPGQQHDVFVPGSSQER